MTIATIAGSQFDLDASVVESALDAVEPEPVQEHYVVIGGRRFPPKQALAVVTGLDRADFTTHQARAVLRRLGFGVYRRSHDKALGSDASAGPRGGAEAALLQAHIGRWVAQDGVEILYVADEPETVLRWLRRHGRRARVWRVPGSSGDIGSALSTP
ncbi:MAG: hypothetical protein ACRD2W_15165 [Acidimicrobiales bacterium]